MLQIFKTSSSAQKTKLLKDIFSTEKSVLVVSDLQSKIYWQSHLKKPVFRASEFWQILIKKTEPHLHIIDDPSTLIQLHQEFDQIIARAGSAIIPDFTEQEKAEFFQAIRKIRPKTLASYFYELFPLFSHPNNLEIMEFWFSEQELANSPTSWKYIYYLCQIIWNNLKKHNLLPERVISSYLLQTLGYEFQWHSPLVFDLGANLESTEAELILTLSQQMQVSVVQPDPDWFEEFHWIKWPYEQLKTRSYKEIPVNQDLPIYETEENKFFRFTNPLSEVKNAIAQIQNWIKAGIPKNKIYITSPDIEDYWPTLKYYLDQAHLLYNKNPRSQLIEILALKKLVSQLKCSFLRSTDKKELEAALYINEETPPLKYDEFTYLYSELFSAKDFFRHKTVSTKLMPDDAQAVTRLSADDFLKLVIEIYQQFTTVTVDQINIKNSQQLEALNLASPNGQSNSKNLIFDELCRDIKTKTPAHFNMDIHYWIYYFEGLLQKKEIIINSEGVLVGEIDSLSATSQELNTRATDAVTIAPLAHTYALTDFKGIFLGLNESSLKGQGNVISGSDVMSLLNKTGNLLNHPDRNYFEFILQWSSLENCGHVFSFTETSWKTDELTPSVFWLLGNVQMSEQTHSEIQDEDKKSKLENNLSTKENTAAKVNTDPNGNPKTNFNTNNSNSNSNSLLEDALQKLNSGLIDTSQIFKSLSPSGLEKYNDCAFKYYAERLLFLAEDKSIDLDPSPLTLGNLYHKLCELLMVNPIRYNLEDNEWDLISDETLNSIKIHELMDFQRTEIKNKLIDWGKSFLNYEKEWQELHPETHIYGRELKVSGFIEDIKFIGKIDRMDWDKNNQYSIVDYKSSVTYLTGPLSWIKNNQLQLLCYIYAAEKGWIEKNNDIKISGAYYLSLKNFDKKGFTIEDCNKKFLSPFSSRSELSAEAIADLLSEFEKILLSSIQKLKSGYIEPIPRDESICHECSWRHLCRAPHLNM